MTANNEEFAYDEVYTSGSELDFEPETEEEIAKLSADCKVKIKKKRSEI